jgi:hypothetical protein
MSKKKRSSKREDGFEDEPDPLYEPALVGVEPIRCLCGAWSDTGGECIRCRLEKMKEAGYGSW